MVSSNIVGTVGISSHPRARLTSGGIMKLESGTCKICGQPIHLTRHCGWIHDARIKNLNHRAIPKLLEVDMKKAYYLIDKLGRKRLIGTKRKGIT